MSGPSFEFEAAAAPRMGGDLNCDETGGDSRVARFGNGQALDGLRRASVVCDGLESETLVLTARGVRPVGSVRVGDHLISENGQQVEVLWTWQDERTTAEVADFPSRRAICIAADAFGAGQPGSDVTLGPDHLISIRSEKAALLFGQNTVFVRASDLLGLPGVTTVDVGGRFVHLALDAALTVQAFGLAVTGCCLTDERVRTLDDTTRAELFEAAPKFALAGSRAALAPSWVTLDRDEAFACFGRASPSSDAEPQYLRVLG